jgi:hypothetical protein
MGARGTAFTTYRRHAAGNTSDAAAADVAAAGFQSRMLELELVRPWSSTNVRLRCPMRRANLHSPWKAANYLKWGRCALPAPVTEERDQGSSPALVGLSRSAAMVPQQTAFDPSEVT